MSCMQIDRLGFHSLSSCIPRFAITAVWALLLATVMQANASIMPGDRFDFEWTGTSGPANGLTGTAQLSLGSSITANTFHLASFDVFQNGGGFCGPCVSLTEDLTAASFDALTLGLTGDITGTFLGQGGGTHHYDLQFLDVSGGYGTWTFTDSGPLLAQVSGGTYDPLVAVPEPATLALLGLGLAGLAASRRRRQ